MTEVKWALNKDALSQIRNGLMIKQTRIQKKNKTERRKKNEMDVDEFFFKPGPRHDIKFKV